MKRKVLIVLVCAVACDQCGPEDRPKTGVCDPCEATAYVLWAQQTGQLGELATPETQPACDVGPSSGGMRGVQCPLLAAHYLARTVRWDGSTDADDRWCTATHVLPCESGSGCGSAGFIGQPANIVGIPEMDSASAHASVALLVNTGLLDTPVVDEVTTSDYFDNEIADMFARDEACELANAGHTGPSIVWSGARPCTAVLIAPGLVLTASHCVSANSLESGKSLVFGYHEISDDQIVEGDRYDGVELVAEGGGQDALDWALLSFTPHLDDNLAPVALPSPETGIGTCETVYAVGHPRGYPLRRSGGDDPSAPQAWSRGPSVDGLFQTTLDTIDGFSGSPVFSLTDDRLVGLVVRGGLTACSETESCTEPDETGAAQLSTAIDLAAAPEVRNIRDEWCEQLEAGC